MGIPSAIDKLGLGTVQFGIPYGLTNERGQVPRAEAAAIIDTALRAGIATFDTAAAYGDSESILGQALESRPDVKVVSKLPPLSPDRIDAEDIETYRLSFEQTLARLRRKSIHGLLLHHPDDLRKPGARHIATFLEDLKRSAAVAKVGVSAYDRSQIEIAADCMPLDLVQVPVNLLDQRLLHDGTLESLMRRGVEVHARSVFLQGALLAEPAQLSPHFGAHRERFAAVAAVARQAGIPRLACCLRFVLAQPAIDRVIVGVTALAELQQIIAAALDATPLPGGLEALASDDPQLINPSRWPPRKPS